jgi:hypothetical protein
MNESQAPNLNVSSSSYSAPAPHVVRLGITRLAAVPYSFILGSAWPGAGDGVDNAEDRGALDHDGKFISDIIPDQYQHRSGGDPLGHNKY